MTDDCLNTGKRKEIKKHLKNCRHCRQEYKFLQFTASAVKNIPCRTLSADFNKKVLTELGLETKHILFAKPMFWILSSLSTVIISWIGVVMVLLPREYTFELFANPYQAVLTAGVYLTKIVITIKQSMQILNACAGIMISALNYGEFSLTAVIGLVFFVLLSGFISFHNRHITTNMRGCVK